MLIYRRIGFFGFYGSCGAFAFLRKAQEFVGPRFVRATPSDAFAQARLRQKAIG